MGWRVRCVMRLRMRWLLGDWDGWMVLRGGWLVLRMSVVVVLVVLLAARAELGLLVLGRGRCRRLDARRLRERRRFRGRPGFRGRRFLRRTSWNGESTAVWLGKPGGADRSGEHPGWKGITDGGCRKDSLRGSSFELDFSGGVRVGAPL